jgi:hypothetical protein
MTDDNDPKKALTALTSLSAMLRNVERSAFGGRSGLPMLQFKRDGSGTWLYGQAGTVVDPNGLWAANPMSFCRGFISFNDNHKVVGERLVSVGEPQLDITQLPDTGGPWTAQWAVNLKAIGGKDDGLEVIYKPTTDGGISAVTSLIGTIRDRVDGGQHDGDVAPILKLEKSSYQHPKHGKVWIPVLAITDWMPLDGPQARRRRVA